MLNCVPGAQSLVTCRMPENIAAKTRLRYCCVIVDHHQLLTYAGCHHLSITAPLGLCCAAGAATRRAAVRAARRELLLAAALRLALLRRSAVQGLVTLVGFRAVPEPGFSWLLSRLVTLLEGRQPAVSIETIVAACHLIWLVGAVGTPLSVLAPPGCVASRDCVAVVHDLAIGCGANQRVLPGLERR